VAENAGALAEGTRPHPDHVASTRLLDVPGARLVLFSFAAGQELREHKAPAPILIRVVSGRVVVGSEGSESTLDGGGIIYFAPSVKHSVRAVTEAQITVTLLNTGEQ
jgi:quercetin dioxygenase-like cupin family protein